jgi:hypothetical protein
MITCAILKPANSAAMIYSEAGNRRESWTAGGWNLSDDDVPKWPEPDPLSSAQSRRFWLQLAPADTAQGEIHGGHIPHQRT